MPRFVEEVVNAMSLFSNDQTVIDQASAVDRGTCNNEGLERKWGLTPKRMSESFVWKDCKRGEALINLYLSISCDF